MTDRLCGHGRPRGECHICAHRAQIAHQLGLPDLAHVPDAHPDAIPCGCCPLPIEPGDHTALTPGGDRVHASCATWSTR